MPEPILHLFDVLTCFLGTHLVHSTVALTLALWISTRASIAIAQRERILRAAVLLSLLSAALVCAFGQVGPGFALTGSGRAPATPPIFRAPDSIQNEAWAVSHARIRGVPTATPASASSPTSATPAVASSRSTRHEPVPELVEIEASTGPLPLRAILALLWIGVAVFLLRRDRVRQRRFAALLARANECEHPWLRRLLSECRAALGVQSEVALLDLPGLASPFCRGGRRPTIYLDAVRVLALQHEEQRLLLRHELLHLRHHDPMWRRALRLLSRVCWQQPLLPVLATQHAKLAELRCDAGAAPETEERLSLARLLVSLAEPRSGPVLHAAAPAMLRRRHELRGRVTALLSGASPARSPRLALLVLPILFSLGLAPGFQVEQENPGPERGLVRGVVRGADQKPMADAQVTLLGRPLRWYRELGELDRVQVRTDARGRFRAQLLRDRRYSGWAMHAGESAKRRLTNVAEDVAPGEVVVLQGTGEARAPRPLRVEGLADWQERGGLRASLLLGIGTCHEIPLRFEGELLQIPPVPGRDAALLLRERSGQLVAVRHVVDDGLALAPIRLTKPHELRIETFEAETEAKVAGAEVWLGVEFIKTIHYKSELGRHLRRSGFTKLGTTDEKGSLSIVVPRGVDKPLLEYLAVQVRHPEYSITEARLRWHSGSLEEGAPLRIRMFPGVSIQGRLMLERENPAANVQLVLEPQSVIEFATGAGKTRAYHMIDVPPYPVHTGTDGRFTIPSLHERASFRLWLVSSTVPGLRQDVGSLLILDGRPKKDEKNVGEIRLDEFVPVEIRAAARSGAPARGPRLHLRSSGAVATVFTGRESVVVQGNRTGVVRTLLRRGAYHGLVVTSDSYALLDFDTGKEPELALRAQLRPMLTVRGVVVDSRGAPVAGARVVYSGCELKESTRGTNQIATFNAAYLGATTDAQGRFLTHFVPSPDHRFRIRAYVDGKTSKDIELQRKSIEDATLVLQ